MFLASVCVRVCVDRFLDSIDRSILLTVSKRLRCEMWVGQFRIVIHTVIISSMVTRLCDIDL